jgi:HPt (histidine-containing phosphotransfer) domain-containing protein
MNDYLTKPFQLSDLDEVLQRALLRVHPAPRKDLPVGESVLDPVIVEGLRQLREPNQPDPLQELTELFLRDAGSRLKTMESAIAKNDASILANAAHTLKGSASNLGARQLAALCLKLEKQAKSGELAEAANILLEISSEFQSVQKALIAEMQK